jgi:flavin reductase (DIM6/NTAB) family NADH-FMN oxidoreductase RutF
MHDGRGDHRNQQLAAQAKLALRRLASAVAVVSCRDGQTRRAMTATAVTAMSMQPPSMIVCVNRAATFHAAISAATRFAINILHRSQIEISMGCGGMARGEDRFGQGAWGEEGDVPILTDAQARVAGQCDVLAHETSFGLMKVLVRSMQG